jgi:hypothetical protein
MSALLVTAYQSMEGLQIMLCFSLQVQALQISNSELLESVCDSLRLEVVQPFTVLHSSRISLTRLSNFGPLHIPRLRLNHASHS